MRIIVDHMRLKWGVCLIWEVKEVLSTCDIKIDISKMISYSGEE